MKVIYSFCLAWYQMTHGPVPLQPRNWGPLLKDTEYKGLRSNQWPHHITKVTTQPTELQPPITFSQ